MEEEIYLTTKQVAVMLGISRQRVQQLRTAGKITARRMGVWVYPKSTLDAEMKSLKHKKRKGTKNARYDINSRSGDRREGNQSKAEA